MKKYKTFVTIQAHKDLGIIEAEDLKDLSIKVRKENLAYQGLPEDHLTLDLIITEVRGYEI